MYGEKNAQRVLVGKPEGKRQLERPRGIIKWILNKEDMRSWSGLIWLKNVTSSGLL